MGLLPGDFKSPVYTGFTTPADVETYHSFSGRLSSRPRPSHAMPVQSAK